MKFELCELVKYSNGSTALAQVTQIKENGDAYGDHCLGGIVSLNKERCWRASAAEIQQAKESKFYCLCK